MSECQVVDYSSSVTPNYVRTGVVPKVRAVNKDTREVLHEITSDSVDRMGDIVEPGGADLENFKRNPVVLLDHLPVVTNIVGKAVSIEIEKNTISARTRFRNTDLGREAFALVREGLGGWSIGFRPTETKQIRDEDDRFKGLHFLEWELLEYSLVAIPANPDIVNNALSKGLVSEAHLGAFFRMEGGQSAAASGFSLSTDGSTDAVEATVSEPTPKAVFQVKSEQLSELNRVVRRLELFDAGQVMASDMRGTK